MHIFEQASVLHLLHASQYGIRGKHVSYKLIYKK